MRVPLPADEVGSPSISPPLPQRVRSNSGTGDTLDEKQVAQWVATLSRSDNKAVQALEISQRGLFDDALRPLVALLLSASAELSFPNLRTLDLSANAIGNDGCIMLAEGLSALRLREGGGIRSLHVAGNRIGSDGVVALADSFLPQGSSKSSNCGQAGDEEFFLDSSDNPLGDAGVEALAGIVCTQRCATALALCNVGCTDRGCVALCKSAPWVTGLDLGYNPVHLAKLEALIAVSGPRLRKLSLAKMASSEGRRLPGNQQVVNEAIADLIEGARCPFAELDISNNDLQDSGLQILVNAMTSVQGSRLSTLDLSMSRLRDGNLLATMLFGGGDNLVDLNLEGNELGDLAITALSAGIALTPPLRKLNLSRNKFGDDGMEALADAIRNQCSAAAMAAEADLAAVAASAAAGRQMFTKWCDCLQLTGKARAQALISLLRPSDLGLSDLDLSLNMIMDRGAAALSKAISGSTSEATAHLAFVDLANNNVGKTGQEALRGAMEQSHARVQQILLNLAATAPALDPDTCRLPMPLFVIGVALEEFSVQFEVPALLSQTPAHRVCQDELANIVEDVDTQETPQESELLLQTPVPTKFRAIPSSSTPGPATALIFDPSASPPAVEPEGRIRFDHADVRPLSHSPVSQEMLEGLQDVQDWISTAKKGHLETPATLANTPEMDEPELDTPPAVACSEALHSDVEQPTAKIEASVEISPVGAKTPSSAVGSSVVEASTESDSRALFRAKLAQQRAKVVERRVGESSTDVQAVDAKSDEEKRLTSNVAPIVTCAAQVECISELHCGTKLPKFAESCIFPGVPPPPCSSPDMDSGSAASLKRLESEVAELRKQVVGAAEMMDEPDSEAPARPYLRSHSSERMEESASSRLAREVAELREQVNRIEITLTPLNPEPEEEMEDATPIVPACVGHTPIGIVDPVTGMMPKMTKTRSTSKKWDTASVDEDSRDLVTEPEPESIQGRADGVNRFSPDARPRSLHGSFALTQTQRTGLTPGGEADVSALPVTVNSGGFEEGEPASDKAVNLVADLVGDSSKDVTQAATCKGKGKEKGGGQGKGKGGKGSMPPPPPKGVKGGGKGMPPPMGGPSPSKAGFSKCRSLCQRAAQERAKGPFHKKLYWKPLDIEDPEGTLFSQCNDSGMSSNTSIDTQALLRMFESERAKGNEERRRSTAVLLKSQLKSVGTKLFSDHRARNIAIVMKRLPVSTKVFIEMLTNLTWEKADLSTDDLEQMLEVLPTKDETNLLKEHQDPESRDKLRDVEQMVLPLALLNRSAQRVRLLCIARSSRTLFSGTMRQLFLIRAACDAIQRSAALQQVMRLALDLGNYINYGDSGRGAKAVSLGSLVTLKDFKTGRMSTLHFLCATMLRADPTRSVHDELCRELKPAIKLAKFEVQTLQSQARTFFREYEVVKAECSNFIHEYLSATESGSPRKGTTSWSSSSGQLHEADDEDMSELLVADDVAGGNDVDAEDVAAEINSIRFVEDIMKIRGEPGRRVRCMFRVTEKLCKLLREEFENTKKNANKTLHFCGMSTSSTGKSTSPTGAAAIVVKDLPVDLEQVFQQIADFTEVFHSHWTDVRSNMDKYHQFFADDTPCTG